MAGSDIVIERDRDIATAQDASGRTTGIVVCIPTYRRPEHLRLTLTSLAAQRIELPFAVVVVDNDAMRRQGVPVANSFFEAGRLSGLCLVEPRQGNCHAINAAFETARAAYPAADMFLMIDDDEVASPDWLVTMVRTADTTGADIVGGPVVPSFSDETKRDLARHPVFAPAYEVSGPVPAIYGCGNCLITRSAFARLANPAFDLRFNFLGGGDTDFFIRCRDAGARFHWAAEAVITETIPPSRTRASWIALRGLRIGAINYHVERKAAPTMLARMGVVAKMLAKVPLSLVRAARLAVTAPNALFALHPLTVAAGGVLAMIGIEPQQYKASKIP